MSRRQLSRQDNFTEISPDVGVFDEDAFDRAMAENPDDAMAMLADMAGATDRRLAAMARRIAGRLVIDIARGGKAAGRGVGQWVSVPAGRSEGDLDIDASLDALHISRATKMPPAMDELRVLTWKRASTALCLLVDRSGSMRGSRLISAGVTAAGCAWRAPTDYSVVAFADDAWVLKSMLGFRPTDALVNDLLRLRGHGVTNLALALETARDQLSRSNAKRRVAILLSDCRQTTGEDPTAAARGLDELAIFAPTGDSEDAELLAAAAGARVATIESPFEAPAALARLLDR